MRFTNKEIIEAIGILSIIASLIFVGLQLRLEGRLALADAYATRAESRMSTLRALLESETALRELAHYRQNNMSSNPIPKSWEIADDPILTESRRIRNELNVVQADNILYQESLGFYNNRDAMREFLQQLASREDTREWILSIPTLSDVTRAIVEGAGRIN